MAMKISPSTIDATVTRLVMAHLAAVDAHQDGRG